MSEWKMALRIWDKKIQIRVLMENDALKALLTGEALEIWTVNPALANPFVG